MKAKDLAALLLQTPDLEVYIEEYESPDFDDGYHYTNSCDGITQTPDGIFINTSIISGSEPRAPSNMPRIGTIDIMMKDREWFRFGYTYHDLSQLVDYSECGYICNYVSWEHGYYAISPVDIDDDWVQEHIQSSGNTHYEPDDVDYVRVLVGFDQTTWEPEYKHFTFDEAIQYALEKQNG